MKANFLGQSNKKFTCNPTVDAKIRIEDLKSWPHKLVINCIDTKGMWCMPFNGQHNAIYSIPTSMDSLYAFFGWSGIKFSRFYEETEPKFTIEVTYEDGEVEIAPVSDGRPILTPEDFVPWTKEFLTNDEWPSAIETVLICNSEEDIEDRADSILEQFIKTSLKRSKFLDFGCGDGYVAQQAANHGAQISVGFDVVQGTKNPWNSSSENSLFTTNFAEVEKHGPYDVILLYDVLDHAEDPVEILRKVNALSKGTTLIKIRCHPWTARHGGHIYKELNKAYAHLMLNKEELQTLGCNIEDFPTKVTTPLITYKKWFTESNLHIVKEDVTKDVLPDLMRYSFIKAAIFRNNEITPENYPQLDVDFIDYQVCI